MSLLRARPRLLAVAMSCAAAASVAACSSSPASSSSAPASSAPAAPSATATPAAVGGLTTPTEKTIAANWTEFFNPKAPTAKRVALLQDASALGSALAGMSSNPQAKTSTAKVTSVAVESATKAQVVYDILVSGTPALTGQKGVAVKSNGTWQVSVASFCALLALQNGGSTSKLPAACKSAA